MLNNRKRAALLFFRPGNLFPREDCTPKYDEVDCKMISPLFLANRPEVSFFPPQTNPACRYHGVLPYNSTANTSPSCVHWGLLFIGSADSHENQTYVAHHATAKNPPLGQCVRFSACASWLAGHACTVVLRSKLCCDSCPTCLRSARRLPSTSSSVSRNALTVVPDGIQGLTTLLEL